MSTLKSRLYTFVTDKANSVKITASRVDGELDQVITALNQKVLIAASAPGSPVNGQTWVDTTNGLVKVYLENEWVIISNTVYIQADEPANPDEGNLWYDTDADIFYVYNGSAFVKIFTGKSGEFTALTEKTTLADADLFLIEDSAASGAKKKVQKSNITTGLVSGFGSWSDKSSSYGAQQAATDGFVVVSVQTNAGSQYVFVYTDGTSDPSSMKAAVYPANGYYGSACVPVKKNDYWKVTVNGSPTVGVYWMPISKV